MSDGVYRMSTQNTWTCRHCGGSAGERPRNLCRRCFNDPAIRPLYPHNAKKRCTRCGNFKSDNPAHRHHCPGSVEVRPCPRCGIPWPFLRRLKAKYCELCRNRAKGPKRAGSAVPQLWPLLFSREEYDRLTGARKGDCD